MLAKLAKKGPDGLPPAFDPETDRLGRLIVWRDNQDRCELGRELTNHERWQLECRAFALEECLVPFTADDVDKVNASLSAMLCGFPQMRQTGEAMDARLAILRAVLRDLPAWAITDACLQIARSGEKWPPSDGEIYQIARSIKDERGRQLRNAYRVLGATVSEGRNGQKPAQNP